MNWRSISNILLFVLALWLSIPMHVLYLLGALLPSLVFAFPPAAGFARTPQQGEGHTLHPTRHPKDNPSDLVHLKAAILDQQLHYEEDQAVGTVTIPVAKYPLVSLDKSDLASATCNYASDTMIVSFKDEESYTVASADWATYPEGFVVISYIPGCGKGVDTLERSFHLVLTIQLRRDERQIVCKISPVELTDIAHPDHDIHMRAERFTEPSGKHAFYDVAPTKRGLNGQDRESEELKSEEKFKAAIRGSVLSYAPLHKTSNSNPGSFEFDTSKGRKEGTSYTLVSAKDVTVTETRGKLMGYIEGVGLLCGDCYARSKKIGYVVDKKVNVANKQITSGDVAMNGGVDVRATLQIKGKVSVSGVLEKEFVVGVPGISITIPGILFIGPAFLFSLGLEGKTTLEGSLSIGFECNFAAISAKLSPKEGQPSSADTNSVTPKCKLIGDREITNLAFTASAYATAGIGLKFQLFGSDKLNAEVSLKIKLAFELLVTSQDGCVKAKGSKPGSDVKVALDVNAYVYAEGKYGRSTGQYNLVSGGLSLYENCDDWLGVHFTHPFTKAPDPKTLTGNPYVDIAPIGRRQMEESTSSEGDQTPTNEPGSSDGAAPPQTAESSADGGAATPSGDPAVDPPPSDPSPQGSDVDATGGTAPATPEGAEPAGGEAQPSAGEDAVPDSAPSEGESPSNDAGSLDDSFPATPPGGESQSPDSDAGGSDTGEVDDGSTTGGANGGMDTEKEGDENENENGGGDENEGESDEDKDEEHDSGIPASMLWSASEANGNAKFTVTISSTDQLVFTPDDGTQAFHTGISTDPVLIYLDKTQQRQMSADFDLKSTGVGHIQMVDFGSLPIGSGDAIAFVSQSSRVFAVSDANSAYNTAACQSADGTWSPLYLLVDGKDLDALEEREPGSGCVAVELQLG